VSETEFDRYAADYRATVNEATGIAGVDVDRLAGHKARLLLGLVEQRLGDASSRKVLDVGCGIGLVDAELVGRVGELHGIDTSQKSLEEAARAVPSARFRHFGGERSPHADAAFDLVFAMCVLHHVPPRDRLALVAEIARVTRPGGIVTIIEHNPLNPATRHIVSRCAFDEDAVLLRCGTGARLLAGAGLEPGGAATSPSGRSRRPSSSESSSASAGCPQAPSITSGQRRAPPAQPFHPVRRRAGRADEEP
jgi:SAM-dependent methyltransferase